jgi:hypothetical protein
MLKRGDEVEEENKQNEPRSRVQNKEASYIIKVLSVFIPSENRTAGKKKESRNESRSGQKHANKS